MAKKPSKKPGGKTIALNKRAKFDYHLEERFEAGLALQGWEVKSMRAGKAQLTDSYVLLKDNEAWLIGANITPLNTASTHFVTEPDRTRKLLLNRRQLSQIFNAVNQKGHACIATALYWKGHLVKCEIALAKGKQTHDKRDTQKKQDWDRQKQRIMRQSR